MRQAGLQLILGLLFLGSGLALLGPRALDLARPPTTAEVLQLSGPLRGLPLPFLWRAWGRTRSDNDAIGAAGIGHWISTLFPEREDLYLYFAWVHAYDLGALSRNDEERVGHLLDALALIERGLRQHPNSSRVPALAAFLLMDRCSGKSMQETYRRLTGQEALRQAGRYLDRAARIAPLLRSQRQLGEVLAYLLISSENYDVAADVLAKAADSLRHSAQRWRPGPDQAKMLARAERLEELGRTLSRLEHRELGDELGEPLRDWLIRDELFGRKPELWRR
ncbi:MAG: hypothetical protein ACE5F1_03965 [Planctomycetota bacterium]